MLRAFVTIDDFQDLIIDGNLKAAFRIHGGDRTSKALCPPIPWESL